MKKSRFTTRSLLVQKLLTLRDLKSLNKKTLSSKKCMLKLA